MKHSAFLTFVALLCLLIGVGLWINPRWLMYAYGLNPHPSSMVLGRILGAMGVGAAVMFWQSRNATKSPALKAILWGGLVANLSNAVMVSRITQMGWINSSNGWVMVLVHFVLAIGFAYCLFGNKLTQEEGILP